MINFAIYDGFVDILTEILKNIKTDVTKFDAVRLTVPDVRLLWHVPALAPVEHYMKYYETNINNDCDNILSLINDRNESFVIDIKRSFSKVYTYQFYEYFHQMFGVVFNIDLKNKRDLYDIIIRVLRVLCNAPQLESILKTKELDDFLRICCSSNAIPNDEIDTWLDYVSICYHKIICAVIFACYNKTDKCNVAPLFVNLSEMFKTSLQEIKGNLSNETDEVKEIELYRQLYNLVKDCHEEIQNFVTYQLYKQFFAFVNRADFQDEVLFRNTEKYMEIFQLYNMFYINVKYKLYRAFGKSTMQNKGMMRNSLLDRQIVLDYLSKFNKNEKTEHFFTGDDSRRFILRLANENDADNLVRLSNPTPPYRRAIFIRFNQKELAEAISKKQLWVIEEEYMGKRILACSAIILYNDSNCTYKSFYAGEMNKKYCRKYYESGDNLPQEYKYIDFDSIIVDDGNANFPHHRSYRGCGFQRLMLILTEEIAKTKKCDYICATVSSFNKPSERNFMLNGYEIEDDTNYPFKEDDPSPFYNYIISSSADENVKRKFYDDLEYEVNAYKDILVKLKIAEEDYRRDMNVPREFVVLKLKPN